MLFCYLAATSNSVKKKCIPTLKSNRLIKIVSTTNNNPGQLNCIKQYLKNKY